MKKQISLLLFVLCYIKLVAQPRLIYDADSLKPYVGTWQWVNANDTIIFRFNMDTLSKSFKKRDSMDNKPGIFIWHKVIKGGILLESNLAFTGDVKKSSGVGTVIQSESTVYLGLGFTDYSRDKTFRIFFKLLNKEGTIALWESWPQERIGRPLPKFSDGQTVPTPIILNKIAN